MSKRIKRRRRRHHVLRTAQQRGFASHGNSKQMFERACQLAIDGYIDEARDLIDVLIGTRPSRSLSAKIENGLAVLDAAKGDHEAAKAHLDRSLELDPTRESSRANLATLQRGPIDCEHAARTVSGPTKVAIVSLLFNWPSTGGGTIHTAEAGRFLTKAGYHVKHFFARFGGWGMGRVEEPLEYDSEPVDFDAHEWNANGIRFKFRQAVDRFRPDVVIVTDSWNTKTILGEAVSHYPYFLRLAALECLCPLNNVRMLVDESGAITACPKNQLSTPGVCRRCVQSRARFTGPLHQAERALAGFEDFDYSQQLRRVVKDAAAVLVVNPLIAEMVRPFAKRVEVVPSGFDPDRFPWPWPEETIQPGERKQIFFAGLVEEAMKGFHVLDAAGRILWSKRQDFEIVATTDPPGRINAYTRAIGWLSQGDLPAAIHAADILAFPTVAEEALGRSAVEAMGVGRPVVAARIGGLQFTVVDGATGLLFEPGNAADLAAKLEQLLDDAPLRERLGNAGRKRFEQEYTWDTIIERHYRPLFASVNQTHA